MIKGASNSSEKFNLKCFERPATVLCSSDAKSTIKNKVKGAGEIITQPSSTTDVEYLYSVRSKSVVKRR
jgi:hypothetical protein